MNCPRDNTVLQSFKKGALEVNHCYECHGFSVLLGQSAAEAMEKQLDRPHREKGEGE